MIVTVPLCTTIYLLYHFFTIKNKIILTFQVIKVLPFSYVLHCYHILQEAFTRAQLEIEAVNGQPAIVVAILDLTGLNVTDFINPLSASARFARLIIKVWADYFTETVSL